MKRFELIFTFLQLPFDYLLLVLAGFTAYALRFSPVITTIRPIFFRANLPWERYWQIVLLVAFGWIIIFIISGLYSTNPNRKLASEITRVVLAGSTGFAAITIYVFFTLQKFDSRFLVLAGWIIATVYLVLGRLLMRGCKVLLYRLGVGLRRVVIIGDDAVARTIAAAFGERPALGAMVVGIFGAFEPKISRKMLLLAPDELILTNPKSSESETLQAIDFANEHHLVFKYSADLFSTIATNMAVSTVAGIPIVEIRRTRLAGWGRIIKRLTDIIGSSILIVLFLPAYAVITLIILIETGRPVLYKNARVGQFEEKFLTLKFRSMFQKDCTGEQFGASGEEALGKEKELIKRQSIKPGPIYKIKDDPRITPFGKIIRRWSLDELPQFINVLKGEMSLVGPRPHQPREVSLYEKHHRVVLAIKPGITGLSQISGRSHLSFEEEVRLDTFYIEHWNLLMDLIIILKTPFAVIKKDGAII